MISTGEKLERLARYITKMACNNWPTFLAHVHDEVLSEAYVAAVRSEIRYPNTKGNGLPWPLWQRSYAYGKLISRLMAEKYLPTQRDQPWPEMLTNRREFSRSEDSEHHTSTAHIHPSEPEQENEMDPREAHENKEHLSWLTDRKFDSA